MWKNQTAKHKHLCVMEATVIPYSSSLQQTVLFVAGEWGLLPALNVLAQYNVCLPACCLRFFGSAPSNAPMPGKRNP